MKPSPSWTTVMTGRSAGKGILMRIIVVATALGLSIAGLSMASAADASIRRTVSIPPQGLAPALQAFAQERELHVVFIVEDVRSLRTQGASGDLTVDEAFQQLLRGTGLTYRQLDDRTVTIVPVVPAPMPADSSSPSGERASPREDGAKTSSEGRAGQSDRGRARIAQADRNAPGDGSAGDEARVSEVEEIIVTAQRRAQRLVDVPMSIAAVSQDELSQRGVASLLDLGSMVPGLVVSSSSPSTSRIFLRGVVNPNSLTSLVGVYLDEIPATGASLGQLDLQFTDLERVEVLRGPQGTLYGQGSAGGTVRYITRKPDLQAASAEFDVTGYATDDGDFSERLTGVVNLPLVDDVFGLRLSGTVAEIGGWIDQPDAGRDNINDQSLRNVRLRALWQASDELSIDATAIVHRNEGDGITAGGDENYDVFYPGGDPLLRQFFEDDYEIYNVTAKYDFGGVTLMSSTSYNQAEKGSAGQKFTLPGPVIFITDAMDNHAFAQEFRLSSTSEGAWNWIVGGFYTDETVDRSLLLSLYADGAPLFDIPLPTIEKSESYSIYGDVNYAVTDRLDVGVGLRYFNDDRVTENPDLVLGGSFDSIDPRLYLTYALTDAINLYANIAKGFRTGGFLGDTEASTFDPEEVLSYEIGTKGSAGQFAWELSAYYSDYKQYQAFVLSSGVIGGLTNAGDAEIVGLDWLFSYRPTDNLILQLNGNVTDTELVTVKPGTTSNVVGDRLDFAHDYSIAASVDYRFEWSVGVPGFIRVDYNEIGPSTFTDRSIGIFEYETDTIGLLNARIGLERGRWAAEVFGQNLLGEDGQQDPLAGLGFGNRPRPLTYGVTVRARF